MEEIIRPDVTKYYSLGAATKAVHAGQHEYGESIFPVPPLIFNSAIPLQSVEHGWEMLTNESARNYAYQRYSNRTVEALEDKFSTLENAQYSIAVNTGMGACYLMLRALVKAGDHVLVVHSMYHEITDQLKFDEASCGVQVDYITQYKTSAFDSAIKESTKLIFLESPTNPSLLDVDIEALSELCKLRGVTLVVDNTLLTPLGQNPLSLGADVTLYSCTKHINGHGDAMGGMICTNNKTIHDAIRDLRGNIGMGLDPMSAWLILRGIRTLPLRLNLQNANAQEIVCYLAEHFPKLEVRSPLTGCYTAKNGINTTAGIITLNFPSRELGIEFIKNLALIRIATTFGNIESLCYHFGCFARPTRDITAIGIPVGLVRLSIGIEDVEAIKKDIEAALQALTFCFS